MAPKIITKTDRAMEDKMLAFAGDAERVDVLSKARAFKRTWIELAEALTTVYDRNSFERWGYEDFNTYCRKELHLKTGTVQKLLGSFRFLQTKAPRVIERARAEPQRPVPSLKAVEFVSKAAERGAADGNAMREIQRAAFDEGLEAPMLSRRFKEIAFPIDESERRNKLKSQLTSTARRLANLIAEPELPVPSDVAVAVEEALGQLMNALDPPN